MDHDPRHDPLELGEVLSDDITAPEDGSARGVAALTQDEFSPLEAIGGVRGLAESVAPGAVFVAVYIATRNLTWSLVSSLAVAVAAVIARLIGRTPVMHAFGGVFGVAIGVVWAWITGEAKDYFAQGLWTNAAYLIALVISVSVRWPAVGVVVEFLRRGFGATLAEFSGKESAQAPANDEADESPEPARAAMGSVPGVREDSPAEREDSRDEPESLKSLFAGMGAWRADPPQVRRYMWATFLWIGMFAIRLAVQLPLYFDNQVGWLGTARLVMGIPLWALVLWGTWVLVRNPKHVVAGA